MTTLLWDARFSLVTALLAGFGRAAAEVGAIIIVGGNIDGFTRTMTTAIALETSKGDLPLGASGSASLILQYRHSDQRAGVGNAPRGRTLPRDEPCAQPPRPADRCSSTSASSRWRGDDSRPHRTDGHVWAPDGPDRTERRRQDHAAARRHGSHPAVDHGRITWGDREYGDAVESEQSCFSVRSMLRRSTARQISRYALAAAGCPARATRWSETAELLALVGLGEARRPAAGVFRVASSSELALARALARDPAVLFLDEPTASLDPHATRQSRTSFAP